MLEHLRLTGDEELAVEAFVKMLRSPKKEMGLTKQEQLLLDTVRSLNGRVATWDYLFDVMFPDIYSDNARNHIHVLRDKITKKIPRYKGCLVGVWGEGMMWKEPEECS